MPSSSFPPSPAHLPPAVAAVLGNAAGRPETIGKSGAQVFLYEDYVLKIRPAGDRSAEEARILKWLEGKLPAPRVAAHEVRDGRDWLLMTRISGTMLCSDPVMRRPSLLLDCMAQALRALWEIPAGTCPFRWSARDHIAHARETILAGAFDPSDCEPETFGPGGFGDPLELVRFLQAHRPPEDTAVTHGDFCLPNLFTDGKRFSGMIDLGDFGTADRWRDLALGWRSLKHNSSGRYGFYPQVHPDDLFRAVGIPKDEDRLRYYILLDELS